MSTWSAYYLERSRRVWVAGANGAMGCRRDAAAQRETGSLGDSGQESIDSGTVLPHICELEPLFHPWLPESAHGQRTAPV